MTAPWAIVRVTLRPARDSRERWHDDVDRFVELAAVLAGAPDVGGVEQCGDAPDRPELRIYTSPDALANVASLADAWSQRFELTVAIASEVRHDDDWRDAWKQFYRPIVVGRHDARNSDESVPGDGALLLRPSWIARRPGDPVREVVLDPGRAFGTGLHETTRLCLDRACRLAQVRTPVHAVLDLGCGSGILALAAARLFVGARVVAIDDDPEATATAAENAALNDLTGAIEIATGDIDALPAAPSFDLVLANIRAETPVPRAQAIAARTLAGGHVCLSGVLLEERQDVEAAYVAAGFELEPTARAMGTWCAIDLRKAP